MSVIDIRRATAIAVLTLALLTAIAGARTASAAAHTVSFRGVSVRVPSGWPVYRLDAGARTCVRFDRHAVYLGGPGADERCPAQPAGRTEAILVAPLRDDAAASGLLPSGGAASAATSRTVARIVDRRHRVAIIATWNRDPQAIVRALGIRSLRSVDAQYSVSRPPSPAINQPNARGNAARRRSADPRTARPVGAPGGVFTGLGFDACATPSTAVMSAWSASPYQGVGVYIGGADMACSQPNLTPSWVAAQSAAGWRLIPIYVGPQAPANSCGCSAISTTDAAGQGAAAAADAITHAQALGLGRGNPVYYDMEGYDRTTTDTATVLSFLQAWTTALHDSGYLSGVYSSDDSGIVDLVSRYGSGYDEPDDIWIANWNGNQSVSDANVPAADWTSGQRLHQYAGAHNATYGHDTINIDSDYLDGATAVAGTGTAAPAPAAAAAPALTVAPAANGTIALYPSWSGQTGVTAWQLDAGPSPSALTPAAPPRSVNARLPIVVNDAYPYFQVLGLDASGQTLGTSATMPTPAHVAIFGNSAFVPRRGFGGLPVACDQAPACVVSLTVRDGTRTIARTRGQRIAAGGGIAYFALSAADHQLVAGASGHRLPVTVTAAASTATSATRALNLVPYSVSGRTPVHSKRPSAALRLVGVTDFVSHGWSGGILVACTSTVPCRATTAIVARGQTIARTGAATLGAGLVGYLPFRLTTAGHALLAATKSNQLGARVTITATAAAADGGASSSAAAVTAGQITLASFS